jgi:hypothetical protein
MMKYYTPKEALRVVRFRQTLHHALSVIAASVTFAGLVFVIACCSSDQWGLSALGALGTCIAAMLCGLEDYCEYTWQQDEKKILAEYGEDLIGMAE